MSELARILDRRYELVVDEQFAGDDLDRSRWIPAYLPHWVGSSRAAATHRVADGRLELSIPADQQPWCPEILGPLRVSSLQTGSFAGPVGSTVGQHRTDDRMIVVEAQPLRRLLMVHHGVVEMRASWTPDDDHMVALWMIGFEQEPHESAEICVCEIFGSETEPDRALIGMGVHPFRDPEVVDDFEKVPVAIDVREPHDYAVEWTPGGATFFVDGAVVRSTTQSPAYPMQLMLNIYDFGDRPGRTPAAPFVVEHIRIHRERAQDGTAASSRAASTTMRSMIAPAGSMARTNVTDSPA